MNKSDVKRILMSLRNEENEPIINYLLGKIDLMDDKSLQSAIEKAGNTEEGVRSVLEEKVAEKQRNHSDEKYPINDMITYGISGNSIHLHLPGTLQQMLRENGPQKTMDTANLYLLDAIERIAKLQKSGFNRFQGKDTIYMISPILIRPEMKFLESMDFKTRIYKKKELQDEQFVMKNPEAMLANHIFGNERNVGTASLSLDIVHSKEWQEKKREKIKEFAEKGIIMPEYTKDIDE